MFNTVLVLLFSLFFFANATPIPVKRDGDAKYVFAHFMVGNSYPYTLDTWLKDISLAQANGIDAFALNVGSDSWQPQQVANAYQAAQQLNNGFKLFLSLDMTVLGCGSPADGQKLVNWVSQYVDHPNQFKYPPSDPKAFVSTFSGETCQFGQGSVAQGWATQFKNPLSSKITFVPAFFGDLNAWGSNGIGNVVDGNFNWNSAWPASTTTSTLSTVLNTVGATISSILHQPLTSSGRQAVQNVVGSLDSDNQQIAALNNLGGNKIYLAGHSPWFFTHYGKDSFNKNWIYLADTLYPTRWQSLVDNRDQFNLVEVITWNDYGESHYIAPVDGAQPNSQSWVDGFDHSAWLDMTQFYSTYFKTGQQPDITDDKVYVWSRGQPKDANAPDPVGKPTNADMVLDSFFALVLAKEPGTVTLSSGSSSQSFPVEAGITQLSLPFSVGNGIKAVLNRNGQDVVTVAPEGFTITGNPQIYNFNAMVAMGSSAPQN